MSDSTGKVLRELSDLTKNIDVLVKEMKEAKTSQDKSTESVKNLSKTLEQNEKKKEGSDKSPESLFQNFIESFKKFNEEKESKFFDDLNKSLSLNLEKIVSNLPNQVAQTKKAETSPLEDTFSKLVKKTTNAIPGLSKGGDVTKSGLAVVGEEGPELVDLNKGDKVLTTSEAQILEKKQQANTKGPTESEIQAYRNSVLKDDADGFYKDFPDELEYDVKQWIKNYEKISDKPNLNDSGYYGTEDVINDLGVKVPRKKIEEKRESLVNPFLADPKNSPFKSIDEINEEINGFVFSFKEEMKLGDSKKQGENLNTETAKESVESKLLQENKKEGKKDKKEKSKGGEGLLSKIQSGAGKLSDNLKESISTQKTSFASALESDFTNLKSSFGIKQKKPTEMSSEKVKGQPDKLTNVQPKAEQKMPPPVQETAVKIAAPTEQKSSTETVSKPTTINPTTEKKSKMTASDMEKNSPLTGKDVSEIKGLLSAIYKTLNGPLNISSDVPFRPFSNQL